MSLRIELLGVPSIAIDGTPRPAPRGRKAWGLLAYLLLSPRRASRDTLARLLFPEADDPLRALRWNLSELRRVLALPDALRGPEPSLELPPDASVDVRDLHGGAPGSVTELPGLGRELLEGMDFSASPEFDTWLLAERRHVQAIAEDVLHEAALARLGAGQSQSAIDLAVRLIGSNPFDENHQELLIRAHAASGDRTGALRQLAACRELFMRELGTEPGPGVVAAAEAAGIGATTAVTGRAAAQAQLDAGEAAIGAGAIGPGLECLRRAAAEAHASGDLELGAQALIALGSALVHAALGRDEEAAAALHEAIALAAEIDRPDLAAAAHRELAWIDMLRARYPRARAQMRAAVAAAGQTPFDVAGEGVAAFQVGRYGEGLDLLERATAQADDLGDARLVAVCRADTGVLHMLRSDLDLARAVLERSVATARSLSWNSFLPYPEAVLGIVECLAGDVDAARERLEHAFALGCQIGDCCWEGLSAAGLGLVEAAQGHVEAAAERFSDAVGRSNREPDASLFGYACVLDLACGFAIAHGLEQARGWVDDLEALASRTMMRDLLARAYLHRADLGDPDALRSAELVAESVDNPALDRAIAERAASLRPAVG